MSDYRKPNSPMDIDPDLHDTAELLTNAASQIKPDPDFVFGLESRLLASHSGSEVPTMFSLKKLAPALLWVLAAVVMVFVIDWAIRSIVPAPIPAAGKTPVTTQQAPAPQIEQGTPVPAGKPYAYNGTTLYLTTTLPSSPSDAGVYLAQPVQHASLDDAMALAQKFGINGTAYQTPGELPGTTDYMISDGKQSLRVRSASYFSYTADIIKSYNNMQAVKNPNAEAIISEFLRSHGFTFPFRVEWSDWRSAYLVQPMTPEGTVLRYEDYATPTLSITLDETGQVASFQASLLAASTAPVGRYGIISADEAFQRLLSNPPDGVITSMHSVAPPMTQWTRSYPTDQTLTIYGRVSSAAAVQPDHPSFIQIDGFPVTGQTSGLEKFTAPTYIEATGRFIVDNGIEKFSIDSWKISDANEDGLVGTLQRESGQVSITTQDGAHYVLPDVPTDVPMPFDKAFVVGTRVGDIFQWKLIDNRMATQGGGGGGGGGAGFHKLNLTGTPVPFPSPTATPPAPVAGANQYVVQAGDTLGKIASSYGTDIDSLMQANGLKDPNSLTVGQTLTIPVSGQRKIDGLRGILSITINKDKGGNQQVTYGFAANANADPSGYMVLQGSDLTALQAYNSRPVDIWGTMDASQNPGVPVVKVERYEIPFPDLKVQVYRGTQKETNLAGQPATLFTTTDGQTHVQLFMDGTTGSSLVGEQGDAVQVEAVAIPGETWGGYPALRVFAAGLAISPKTGQPVEMPITADKPTVIDVPSIEKPMEIPTLTIERVELVHFTSDQRYAVAEPNAGPAYFQPVWRFYGHYSNGDEFEMLIQALRNEYLLPETEPGMQPG